MSGQLPVRVRRPSVVKRVLALALLLVLTSAGCDDHPPAARADAPSARSLGTEQLVSWPVDPGRVRMLSLGPSYVAWAATRDDRWQTGPRRVVVADRGSGVRRTVYRTAYDGGQVSGIEAMPGRVLVADSRPGEHQNDPPVAWRLVSVDLGSGRQQALATSRPGVVSWAPWPVSNGDVAGWVSEHGVASTWRPGSEPRRWGSIGRATLVGVVPDGLVLSHLGHGEVGGLHRTDLELRTGAGTTSLTDDGLLVEADVDGSTLVWSERSATGELADPADFRVLDLDHPDRPAVVHRGSTGYELHAGDGLVLWSGAALGLRVAPAEGGHGTRLPARRVPGTSNAADVRGRQVAYVTRTPDGPRLVVLRIS